MAQYHVTAAEITELFDAGWKPETISGRVDHIKIHSDGTATCYNRVSSNQIDRMLADAREKAARQAARAEVAEGRQVQWRKVGREWLLAGRDLATGDIVTVTRRNGTSSEEFVGDIVAVKDGVTLARVGVATTAAQRTANAKPATETLANSAQVERVIELLIRRARTGEGDGFASTKGLFTVDGAVDRAAVAAMTGAQASQLITSLTGNY
jgi:hypothetical protein